MFDPERCEERFENWKLQLLESCQELFNKNKAFMYKLYNMIYKVDFCSKASYMETMSKLQTFLIQNKLLDQIDLRVLNFGNEEKEK